MLTIPARACRNRRSLVIPLRSLAETGDGATHGHAGDLVDQIDKSRTAQIDMMLTFRAGRESP